MDETFFTRIDWRDDIAYRDTIRYWSEQADGVAPIRLTGPPSPGTEGTTSLCSVLLSETETLNLDHVVRRRRATLFSALLAVLANTIAADFADPDVRLLTLAAARDTPDLERMVGLLLSPLLLRTPVIGSDTFGGGLQRAAALVREALAHGRVPLLALCEEIPDLMALMTESQFVAVESLPEPSGLRLGGCTIRRSDPFDDDFAGSGYRLPVDLLVVARPEGARVRIAALFDPASFDGSYIRRLLDRVREALARGAADPDLLMSALTPADPAILADQEQHDE
jgi:non-ribosomal peptide synthetase component F